ncbi:GNAT family N-acetyltransferase [Aureispira anguillae]|uniref:GNAT family N-acetyltransferase n=1 Tax=Aureispira anguillae TaxID=2864201 RepID=A0A915YAH9_9BACT|nr:GNAT family N-acetyltransferase [Aureispira anguillae]BDS09722.1 GNAT family N-acetyltransferase [Aureispira anguillae]
MNYTIRALKTSDVPEYLALTKYIDAETDFLGSAPTDPRPSMMQVIGMVKAQHQIIFVAEDEQGLVGHLGAFWRRGKGERLQHCMTVGLGVLKKCWGQGIGNALFEALESWATANGISRLELEVMTHNKAAIALYRKRGFEIEGTKRNSIKMGTQYIDEHLMAKLLV